MHSYTFSGLTGRWPGVECSQEEQNVIKSDLSHLSCVPVFIPDAVAEDHYNGFSNSILWPLFENVKLI